MSTSHAQLGRHEEIVAVSSEDRRKDLLGLPAAVRIGRVDEVDPCGDRPLHHLLGLDGVDVADRTHPAAERHGTQRQAGHLES